MVRKKREREEKQRKGVVVSPQNTKREITWKEKVGQNLGGRREENTDKS